MLQLHVAVDEVIQKSLSFTECFALEGGIGGGGGGLVEQNTCCRRGEDLKVFSESLI